MFKTRARPGLWFGSYHTAWSEAHPGAFMRGEMQSGGFHKGNVWVTHTPDFDKEWFVANGMKMPLRVRVTFRPPVGIPLCDTLGPGESVEFRLGIENG